MIETQATKLEFTNDNNEIATCNVQDNGLLSHHY